MHTPQLADNLRRALLQAAIEGKLTERQADDGHAQDLLKQIQAEKAALVKAGRLKKSKGLPEIGEDEKPFAIPENWVWVRLGDIFSMQAGKFIKADDIYETGEYPCFGGNGMRGYTNTYNREGYFPLIGRQGALCGNIKIANGKFYATEHAVVVETFADCNPLWAGHFLTALDLNQYATSTAQPGLSVEKISVILIPLPPLAEQARIVAKLDALLAETDALKAQETALADVQKSFPKTLRASLLQAAVEGKLTERESGDGHAQELLAAIQAEKAALVKAGRLKKSKGLPEIGEDEKPFAIPENWVWVKLGEIAQINPRNKADDETVAAFVPMNLLNGGFQNSFSFEERAWKAIKKGYTHFAENDVVIAKITPCFQNRKSAVMRGLPNKIGAGTTELHVLRPYSKKVMPEYLLLIAKNAAFISGGVANFTGTAGQQRVSSTFVENYPIPLPPLAEQARIVAKLDALLAQIESLENLS
ncbi:MAG: restriction endonuclease subunit S [Neisseria zoodegmatis]|uniref:restriction endonuclease subunit S n=1 Tax=Neisseria zoodegmatis TaxID=326523 RepID=UPI0026EA4506|nr:restriction endonuclease subunit S [Neisseria zoodegmatis]MDO5069689.1 restriction endonuclease subunit S [Neisseria zoodegmatis]